MIADPKTEEGRARLRVLESTNDGFKVAEEDLKLRGPGEFLGTRQSGLDLLPFIDLLTDSSILLAAREEAFALLQRDPGLTAPDHERLRGELTRRYRSMIEFNGTN